MELPIYRALLLLGAIYVLARGSAPERIAMITVVVGSELTLLAVTFGIGTYDTAQYGVLAIDLVVLAIFGAIALRADRFWPLWLTGCHIIGVLAHLAKMLAPDLHPWAYAVALSFGGYLMIALIVVGTFRHQQRLKQSGADPSWSRSSSLWGRV